MHIETATDSCATDQQKIVAQSHIRSDMWFLKRGTHTWPFFMKVYHHITNILTRTALLPEFSHCNTANNATTRDHGPNCTNPHEDQESSCSQIDSSIFNDVSLVMLSGDVPTFQSGFGYGIDDWMFDPVSTSLTEF